MSYLASLRLRFIIFLTRKLAMWEQEAFLATYRQPISAESMNSLYWPKGNTKGSSEPPRLEPISELYRKISNASVSQRFSKMTMK